MNTGVSMKSGDCRYLVLTELFLPTKGGTAVWFAEVYKRLGGKGIHVVTKDVPGAAEVDKDHPNSIHRLKLVRRPWLKPESLGMYTKLLLKSLWLGLTHRFSAVHAGRVLPEGLIAWGVARVIGRPVLVYAHGEELTGWGRGRKYQVMRFVLHRSDRVIANSDHTRRVLCDMGVDPDRIILINPGVDIRRFRPGLAASDLRQRIGLGAEGKLLLSIGRLQRRKGFDMVVKSLPELVQGGLDLHYAVVGIGEDERYLEELAATGGVTDRVHLLGHVDMDELPRWYNACDLFVMPNREIGGDTEGFGMVYIEAAACGKPSVAGAAGGTGSAVLDGVTGLRIDGTDPDAVREALSDLLQDDARIQEMGARALDRAKGEFTWDRVVEKTLDIRL